jgi:hypothetical protein
MSHASATKSKHMLTIQQTANDIQGKMKLHDFLKETLPEKLPQSEEYENILTRDDFIKDVMDGIDRAPMSIRISPHIISSIDWANPLEDPLRRQFIPMMSTFQKDHPVLTLDPQHETEDSPVEGLVHRYNDKCLFLGASLPYNSLITRISRTLISLKRHPTALSIAVSAPAPTLSEPTPQPSLSLPSSLNSPAGKPCSNTSPPILSSTTSLSPVGTPIP